MIRSASLPHVVAARALLVAWLLAALLVPASFAAAQTPAASGCRAMFPDVTWGATRAAGPVTIYTSDVSDGRAERFFDELQAGIDLIQPELGGLDGVEVCIFADELPLDSVALGWPVGQRLRAASFGSQRVLVLSAWRLQFVEPAGIFGLAHQAEWGVAGGSYPEPWGSTVGHWYVSRATGRLDSDHAAMRFANLVRSIPEDIPWTAGVVDDVMLWNPEFQRSPIGDFVEYAVSTRGVDVLRNPTAAVLAQAQVDWQRELLNEARGSEEGTKGWIVGVAVMAVVVAFALVLAIGGLWRSRRKRHREMATIPVSDASGEPSVTAAPTRGTIEQ